MTAPYHPALTITVRRTTVSPFPTIPGIDHLKSFLKSKLKPKSEKHAAGSRSKTEPADDYDDPGCSDTADGRDYASEYTDTYPPTKTMAMFPTAAVLMTPRPRRAHGSMTTAATMSRRRKSQNTLLPA